MNIAIVDDSAIDLEILHDFAVHYCESTCLSASIETFHSGSAFLDVFHADLFDLIFLDIMMEDIDGISLAKKIRKLDTRCCIIFSTASEDYAVEGFQVQAFDYMLKPLSYEHFQKVCDQCVRLLPSDAHYLRIKEGRSLTTVFLSEILYTDYYNHYIQIHTDKSVIRSYMPFADFEPMLDHHPQFLCCYRNYIVNMDKIDSMEDRCFVLKNGVRVPISAKMKYEVQEAYREYLFARKIGG